MSKSPLIWPTHRSKRRHSRALARWRRRQERLGRRHGESGDARMIDGHGPNRLPVRQWERRP